MGKVSDQDFAEMAGRLRTRAAGLMRQLDAGASYSAQIEREMARRLEAAGAPPPAAEARAGRFCAQCGSAARPGRAVLRPVRASAGAGVIARLVGRGAVRLAGHPSVSRCAALAAGAGGRAGHAGPLAHPRQGPARAGARAPAPSPCASYASRSATTSRTSPSRCRSAARPAPRRPTIAAAPSSPACRRARRGAPRRRSTARRCSPIRSWCRQPADSA